MMAQMAKLRLRQKTRSVKFFIHGLDDVQDVLMPRRPWMAESGARLSPE
jgi:hypothetical protein